MNNDITFTKHPIRDCLNAADVAYWRRSLPRLLKIGLEFEFNLPDKDNGTCKGKSFTCPCVSFGKEELTCWQKCLREKTCSADKNTTKCKNFDSSVCTDEMCAACDKYDFLCSTYSCSNYVSACSTCTDFKMNCNDCQYRFDPNKNPEAIRSACINEFNPSGTYGKIAKSGVHKVVTDGSLLGGKGMEVITTGRRVDYWEFFKMSDKIINNAVARGAYVNERCSIHMHGLASYYGQVKGLDPSSNSKIDELERSVPEIVLANFHQLIRRYQNAMTWMSVGLDDPAHITRWEKFRMSVLDVPAVTEHMRKVKDAIVQKSGGTKYGLANYKFCGFDSSGQVNRLHVELRVMDGLLSPSAVAAFSCLYYALFIKAVELSRYGVMDAGNEAWLKQSTIIKNAIMNGASSWDEARDTGRFSDTSELHKYTDILVAESYEMISMLKHILSSIGPAYEVLEKLAEAPCGIRRCEGKSWEDIEKDLAVELTEEGATEYEIQKIIATRAVIKSASLEEWTKCVAKLLKEKNELEISKESEEEIADRVAIHIEDSYANGNMLWADKIGSVIAV